MDIGVFIPIANNGWIMSSTSPQYLPSFDLNKAITLKAETYGLEFALSMINTVYAEFFPGDKPARFCIQCGLMRPDFLVEIATIAHIGK